MATAFHSLTNNAYGTLDAAIDNDDTSIVLSSGEGARFPSSGKFYITIDSEIIEITSRSTDTLTVQTRGVSGTTASGHDAGADVELLVITAYIDELQTAVNTAETTVASHTTSINGIIAGTQSLAKILASGSAASSFTIDNASTNTTDTIAAFYHTTSGTAANNIGAKIIIGAENASGTIKDSIELRSILATATNGAENSTFSVFGLSAGASAELMSVRGSDKMFTTHGTFLNDGATQWILQHQPSSGTAGIRFAPVPDSTSAATVDFFRTTTTSGSKTFAIKLGDGSNNNAFAVFVSSGSPSTHFYNGSGSSVANFDASGNLTISGDAAINGGDITSTGDLNIAPAGNDLTVTSANFKLSTVGYGIYVKEGSNATMGTATLVGGTITVNTTKVTANSRIILTNNANGGTVGTPYISARSAGTSFTITSTSGTDTSSIAWMIIEPA